MKKILYGCAGLLLSGSALLLGGCADEGLAFQNNDAKELFAEVFSKEANKITEDDLASIRSFSVITYSQTNQVEVLLDGYDDAEQDEKQNFARTVDITDLDLKDLSDFHYLTGLEKFYAAYAGYESYDFLTPCQNLTTISLESSYACYDYSFLKEHPNLTHLALSNCELNDSDFLQSLNRLTILHLDSVTIGEYPPADLEFVSYLPNLTDLSVSRNYILDLSPLTELKALTHLNLSYGTISDVSVLAEMPQLVYIDLTQNSVRDVSSLTTFDPENFERLILDLNSSISDWSPLEYIWDKVQGKPTRRELEALAQAQAEQPADENANEPHR